MKKYIKIEHIVILLLSLVGLYLRIHVIQNIPTTQLFDFSTYYEVADNIYNNLGFTFRGYPIAFQGMGYSTILGYWFKFFGDNSELCAKWMNVVMSMGTIYLVYYILNKLTKSKVIIMLSTIAVIFLPHHITYVNTIGTEVMSAFFLAGVIAIQVTDFNWKIKYPVLGVAVGIMALTKPFFLAYPLVLALVEWLKEKDYKDCLKLLVVVTAFMMLVISPWTLRNYKKFDRFIPISYNSGFNLYINNNANNVHGGWQSFDDIYKTDDLQEKIDEHLFNPLGSVKIASDIELDFKPEAKKWISENPGEFFKLGVIRVHSTYFKGAWDIERWAMNDYRESLIEDHPEDEKEIARHFNFMVSVYDILLYIISVSGLLFIILNFKDIIVSIFAMKKKIGKLTSIVFLNLSYISLVYFVYEGQPRYNFIVLFLLIIAASIMIDTYSKNKTTE
jgi:4-amino-4-deoxy-L-arabinose transferase-like glycosyltransferase